MVRVSTVLLCWCIRRCGDINVLK